MAVSLKVRKLSRNLKCSSSGLAIPVTFLILFVSLLTVISATYYFAVARINSKSKSFNVVAAKQNMVLLEEKISRVAWNEKASAIYDFEDCGGTFKIEPQTVRLTINVSGASLNDNIYDFYVGKIVYVLSSSETFDVGLYLKGDSRVVVNQSGSVTAKLFVISGENAPEIALFYRPMVSVVESGIQNGKPLNILRVYVVSLNSSQTLQINGEFSVKTSCLEVEASVKSYDFSTPISRLDVNVDLNGESGRVSVPVSYNENGAVVQVEVVTCQIRVERVQR